MELPDFNAGVHFSELRGGRFRFELTKDVSITIPCLKARAGGVSFRDYKNVEWAVIHGDELTVRCGYRWNGASPKVWFLGRWWGTPDYAETVLGTLVHDVCFQFMRTYYWPEELGFAACNTLFHSILVASGFRLANSYHGAVKDFGKLFTGEFPRRGEFSVLLPS